MSAINTGPINVSYPVPGVNNSSQGFRDNFTSIKNNLDTAADELTELQNKAVLKSALDDAALNNDMANTLISNAAVQGFRSVTNNLGNNLSGTVTVDVSKADVHYGTVTGNISLGFQKWSPSGTQSNVQVILAVPTGYANSVISLPSNLDPSKVTLENFTANGNSVIVANGVSELHFAVSTEDCGNTLTIEPVNRPRKATQLVTSVPSSNVGRRGDRAGTIAADANYVYVCTADYNGTTAVWKRIALSAW
jgi:hypothetical protein